MIRKTFQSRYIVSFLLLLCMFQHGFTSEIFTKLKTLGYSLIPSPQKVEVFEDEVIIDGDWKLVTHLQEGRIAVRRTIKEFLTGHGLHESDNSDKKIILTIDPKVLPDSISDVRRNEGYRLDISQDKITITGVSETGIFYGIQSLKQLIRQSQNILGKYALPHGRITDWPDLELRVIHWDTKHHQDRIPTLKRFMDQAAFYKVNAVAFEMEDKYEYPSHPIIGAPGAFTKAEMKDLTHYALNRNIELIPAVQAPAHMTYVLKHEQFAHLRSDSSNYQACLCDEEAMELIFNIYQDMIEATPGVQYFLVSTDEVYYAGICAKCPVEYNEKNRSQYWVDFMTRVSQWMKERDREVISWVEYPLLTEDIKKLPEGLIDGATAADQLEEWIQEKNKNGVRQLLYNSMQGAEYLFPNYFPTNYRNHKIGGRLRDTRQNFRLAQEKNLRLLGTFAAAWDDAGLHNETFWLGWATAMQYAWTTSKPSVEQSTSDFMNTFYGYDSPYVVDLYQKIEEGARYYESLWDKRVSTERKPGYGNSYGKGLGTTKVDLYLQMPSLPDFENGTHSESFSQKYKDKIETAFEIKDELESAITRLNYSVGQVRKNQYNIEVLLSIAELELYTAHMVIELAEIDRLLRQSESTDNDKKKIIHTWMKAYTMTSQLMKLQSETWQSLKRTWQKSRYEKGRSVGEKKFVHVFDDVKDHFADRRLGLDYMLAPFQRMEMGVWKKELKTIIYDFAEKHDLGPEVLDQLRLED